jgi:hypothetical protein
MAMDWEQTLRQQWRDWRQLWSRMRLRAGDAGSSLGDAGLEALAHPRAGLIARAALVLALVLIVLYPLLAWTASTIDDDPNFAPTGLQPHMSRGVAAAAALLDREVNVNGWSPNVSWFRPSALLDNMPNYQRGIVAALARFSLALSQRAASPDPDLQNAAGFLQYPPDMGVWNPSVSLWPMATSEAQYQRGIDALKEYNSKLADGQATFDSGSDSLERILEAMASDLDFSSMVLETYVRKHGGFPFDGTSDDLFYETKGRIYADYVVLAGLRSDFAGAIGQRNLSKRWSEMMASLRAAIGLRPAMVLNGAPDSDLFACTLCGEGLYLSRARSQLRDLAEALR